MVKQQILCPSESELLAYDYREVEQPLWLIVHQHVAQCADCRKKLTELTTQYRSFKPSEVVEEKRSQQSIPLKPHELPTELSNRTDYTNIKELGSGGMGTVFLATNSMLARLEVLKLVGKQHLNKPGALERFRQEIQSAARLHHPNVVMAYSAIQSSGSIIFAMEYVQGIDLQQVVKKRGPLSVQFACHHVAHASLGLQHAHERNMVHRDIKPANLILTQEGRKRVVKILDFGLAKITSEQHQRVFYDAEIESPEDSGLTRSGQMMGTPDYVAPEQVQDAATADIRADIYSLGCTLYFLLTGQPPFKAKSVGELFKKHQTELPLMLNLIRPEIPPELSDIVNKMLAKKPEDRYQTPAEVAEVMKPFIQKVPRTHPVPQISVVGQQPPVDHENVLTQKTEPTELRNHDDYHDFPFVETMLATPEDDTHEENRISVGQANHRNMIVAMVIIGMVFFLIVLTAAIAVIKPWETEPIVAQTHEPKVGRVTPEVVKPGKVTETLVPEKLQPSQAVFPKVEPKQEPTLPVPVPVPKKKDPPVTASPAPPKLTFALPKPKVNEDISKSIRVVYKADAIPLFNHLNLNNWLKIDSQGYEWLIEDGVLVGKSKQFQNQKGPTQLVTKDPIPTHFHVSAESLIPIRTFSGIKLGIDLKEQLSKGFRVHFDPIKKAPNEFNTGSVIQTLQNVPLLKATPLTIEKGESFQIDVLVLHGYIEVFVNQVRVCHGQLDPKIFENAHLGLFCRAGNVVRFQKLVIRELDPMKSTFVK